MTFSQQHQISKHDPEQIMSPAAHILHPCYGSERLMTILLPVFSNMGKTALPEEAPPNYTKEFVLIFITHCKQGQTSLQRRTDTLYFGQIKVHILVCVCYYRSVNTFCNTTIHGTWATSYTNSVLSLCCWTYKYRHMMESKTGATSFFFFRGTEQAWAMNTGGVIGRYAATMSSALRQAALCLIWWYTYLSLPGDSGCATSDAAIRLPYQSA